MKAKILKTIDENLLDNAIDEWIFTNYPESPFLIMSKQTMSSITSHLQDKYGKDLYDRYLCSYRGYSIAICDDVPFGEVEIR